MELTARILRDEVDDLEWFFEMVGVGAFDKDLLVPDGEGYEVSIDVVRAAYLKELLRDAVNSRLFESFASYQRRHRDQLTLNLVPVPNRFQLVESKEA